MKPSEMKIASRRNALALTRVDDILDHLKIDTYADAENLIRREPKRILADVLFNIVCDLKNLRRDIIAVDMFFSDV